MYVIFLNLVEGKMALGCFDTVGGSWNKSLHHQPMQQCYCENTRSPASARSMRLNYSMMYMQLIHAINGLLQGISSLKAGGPHAIQGKREKGKTPLTNQAINHLAVSVTVTHSGQKLAEFTSLCKLLCCYKITLPPISTQTHMQ